jgi:dTDP-4-amino-4,6-dideoxygalactose transaminase
MSVGHNGDHPGAVAVFSALDRLLGINQARDAAGKYLHSEMGYNYRLGSLAAALGMAQLERIDELLGAKRRIAGRYREAFSSARHIACHPEPQKVEGSYWLYSILAANPSLNARWLASLNQAGIMARPFFMPLHRQPYLPHRVWTRTENGVAPAETGVSDVLAECGINLPSSCGMSEEDQQIVIDHLLKLAME